MPVHVQSPGNLNPTVRPTIRHATQPVQKTQTQGQGEGNTSMFSY